MSDLNLSITEQLAYSTVRIICTKKDGRPSSGTGYFYDFGYLSDVENANMPVIVTNKHVIRNGAKVEFVVNLQENGKPTNKLFHVTLTNIEQQWFMHPKEEIDLCIFPIAPLVMRMQEQNKKPFFISIGNDFIPSQDEIDELTAMEDIVMVGYPNGIWDSVNNQPVFRKGITATHPAKDYNGKPEFMIDAACFPGSSGSPVFLMNLGGYQTRKGHILGQSRVKLLGTLYAGPQYNAKGEIKVETIPTENIPVSLTAIPNNLGNVIKARALKGFESILKQK
ncbi:MAG: serine protease [Balneola sp.]|nr:serine protease [Balneola sp.]|tara:strand:+ start:2250 stop:3089 length:840 start_codon:yes stop_codon:yes gene_type:complete